jgi:hypothetical protein
MVRRKPKAAKRALRSIWGLENTLSPLPRPGACLARAGIIVPLRAVVVGLRAVRMRGVAWLDSRAPAVFKMHPWSEWI